MEFSAQSSTAQPQFSAPTTSPTTGSRNPAEGPPAGDGRSARSEEYAIERIFEATGSHPNGSDAQAPARNGANEAAAAPPDPTAPQTEAQAEPPSADSGPIRLGIWTDDDDPYGLIDAVAERLPERYHVRPFHVSRADIEDQARYDLSQVDMVWYDWATPERLALSDFTNDKPALVHLHPAVVHAEGRREARWNHLDHLVFPTPATQKHFIQDHRTLLPEGLTGSCLPAAVDVDAIPFDADRPHTRNVALFAPLGPADSPALVLQILDALVAADERYHFHIAGPMTHHSIAAYLRDQAEARGVADHVHFYGAVSAEERARWLDQCSYVLSTRLVDGNWGGLAEGMARGLKPVIHHLPGADELFPPDQLFTTVDEAVAMLTDAVRPTRYRRFVKRRGHVSDRADTVVRLLDRLAAQYYPERMGNYFKAWKADRRPASDQSPETLYEAARTSYADGNVEEAAAHIATLDIAALPDDAVADARLLALRVTVEAEAYTDALFHADAAMDAWPEEPIVLHLMGTALWAEGHHEAGAEALVYAAELLEAAEEEGTPVRDRDDAAEVYYLAGEVCEQFGEASSARHFFELAQTHAPDEPEVAAALRRVQPQATL